MFRKQDLGLKCQTPLRLKASVEEVKGFFFQIEYVKLKILFSFGLSQNQTLRFGQKQKSLFNTHHYHCKLFEGFCVYRRPSFNTQASYSLNNILNQKICLTQIFEPQNILGPKLLSDPKYLSFSSFRQKKNWS